MAERADDPAVADDVPDRVQHSNPWYGANDPTRLDARRPWRCTIGRPTRWDDYYYDRMLNVGGTNTFIGRYEGKSTKKDGSLAMTFTG